MELNTLYQINITGFNVPWKYKLAKQGFLKTLRFEQCWEQQAELQTGRGNSVYVMGKTGQTFKSIQKVKDIWERWDTEEDQEWRYACRSRLYSSLSQNVEDRLREGRQEPANCFWRFCRWTRTEMSKESACCMVQHWQVRQRKYMLYSTLLMTGASWVWEWKLSIYGEHNHVLPVAFVNPIHQFIWLCACSLRLCEWSCYNLLPVL